MTKELIGWIEQWHNYIPAILKFQTYKEYPLDLYHREFIIALRMNDGEFHQTHDGEKKWLNYTW